MASVSAAGFNPIDRGVNNTRLEARAESPRRPDAPSVRDRSLAAPGERRGNAAVAEGGSSPSTVAAREQVRTMRREMTGAEPPAGAGGIRREARLEERRIDFREAMPAVATAAEDLRSRMTNESRRAADAMTEAAAQRALREYTRAG